MTARGADLDARLRDAEPRLLWGTTALVFGAAFALAASLYLSLELLYDTDSYLHLAIAREYGRQGLLSGLGWARFSLMHEGYGDKELLFHVLLAPFTLWADAETGGKLALAALNAALAATLWNLGARAVGSIALLAPVMTMGLSGSLLSRLIRLRPELLAVILLLWIAFNLAERRRGTAALLSLLFTLAYTAVQALLGLLVLWFLWDAYRGRRSWDAPICAAAALAGLVVHPHFPANLHVFWAQNVSFFALGDGLDVGAEFGQLGVGDWLRQDGALLLAACALWSSRRPAATPCRSGPQHAGYFGLACLPFGVLFATGARFTTFFTPFAVLALLFELGRQNQVPGARLPWPRGRRGVRTWLVLALSLLGLVPSGRLLFVTFASEGGLLPELRTHMLQFGRSLPKGARVLARWSDAGDYVFWAPQALYTNLFDPVFMVIPHEREYWLQRKLFDGKVPDSPLAAATLLDSDHIAFQRKNAPELEARLSADPRARRLLGGIHSVFALVPGRNTRFVLDWRMGERPYPRLSATAGAAMEGYVDAARLGAHDRCVVWTHRFVLDVPARRFYELAPSGPAGLSVDGVERAQLAHPAGAVLGRGVGVALELPPGLHVLSVRSCPGPLGNGFYLLDRSGP